MHSLSVQGSFSSRAEMVEALGREDEERIRRSLCIPRAAIVRFAAYIMLATFGRSSLDWALLVLEYILLWYIPVFSRRFARGRLYFTRAST